MPRTFAFVPYDGDEVMKVINIHERELDGTPEQVGLLITAQALLGQTPGMKTWSIWVRFLRWAVSGGKAPSQVMLEGAVPGEKNGLHN